MRKVFSSMLIAMLILSLFLTICARTVHAELWHYLCSIWSDDQTAALGGELSRVDILYPGTPEPSIFMDVTLYPPFTSYETDGEKYLYIYASEPIKLPDPPYKIKVVTFETILDWGLPGEPTPFTYVEYGAPGFQVSGVLYNYKETVGGFLIPVDKFGLLAPYIGLASTIVVATVAAVIYVKRVKSRKEKQ